MLIIKVELHPHGQANKARLLSEMRIWNVGGTDELGNYALEVDDDKEPLRVRRGGVSDHPRLTASVWLLVAKALKAAGYRV